MDTNSAAQGSPTGTCNRLRERACRLAFDSFTCDVRCKVLGPLFHTQSLSDDLAMARKQLLSLTVHASATSSSEDSVASYGIYT